MTVGRQSVLRYLSHPQVQIDESILVPNWGLSDLGIKRTNALNISQTLAKTTAIITSTEIKAIETANIIASFLNLKPKIYKNLHENDRSSTGFLKPDEFENVANKFFAEPEKSIRGWERAIDAQTRIVKETMTIINAHKNGDILMIGHGGVGTLLMSHFAGLAISREYDQLAGGGNFFSLRLENLKILHHWLPMEKL